MRAVNNSVKNCGRWDFAWRHSAGTPLERDILAFFTVVASSQIFPHAPLKGLFLCSCAFFIEARCKGKCFLRNRAYLCSIICAWLCFFYKSVQPLVHLAGCLSQLRVHKCGCNLDQWQQHKIALVQQWVWHGEAVALDNFVAIE